MLGWLKLIRIKNLILIGVSQILMVFFLFGSSSFNNSVFSYILCTFFLGAGGNIINDYFDINIDNINKPHKQIINKLITKKLAFKGYIFFNSLGLISGIYTCILLKNYILVVWGLSVIVLLYLYSKKLKSIALIGNLIIAGFTAFSILFFLMIIPCNLHQKETIYVLAFFAFLLNFIREIVKDMEDIKGDCNANLRTLPILIGLKRSTHISKFLIYFTLTSLIPVIYITNNFYLKTYIIITLISPLIYAITILKRVTKKHHFTRVSTILKFVIAFGIFTLIFI